MTADASPDRSRRGRRPTSRIWIGVIVLAVFVWDRYSAWSYAVMHRQLCEEGYVSDPLRDRRERLPLIIKIGESFIASPTGYAHEGYAHDFLSDPRFSSIVQRNYQISPILDKPYSIPVDRFPFLSISLPREGVCESGAVMTTEFIGASPERRLCITGISVVPHRKYVFSIPGYENLPKPPKEFPGIRIIQGYGIISNAGEIIEARHDYGLYESGLKLVLLHLPGDNNVGPNCIGIMDLRSPFSLYQQSSGENK